MALRALRAKAAAVLLLIALPARAQDVPPQLALALMLKVVTYDANFKARGDGDFVVLVPFEPGQVEKAKEIVTTASGLSFKSINSRALKFSIVPLAEFVASRGSAVLLYPGCSAEIARAALDAAHKERLYTLAFDEERVRDGAMLGVASNEGKPQVVVNITTARQIGVDLATAVLKVARTIQ